MCGEADGEGEGPGDIGGVQGAVGAIGIDIGDVSQEQADAPSGVSGADVGGAGGRSTVSRGVSALSRTVTTPNPIAMGLGLVNPALGFMANVGELGVNLAGEFGGTVGPSNAEPGEAGAGPGGEADTARQPQLARSVRSAGVEPTPGASRRLGPAAPAPTVPAGPTQEDLDRERREESDARRRRAARRQGRQSTIVTGPLGLFGPPELLQARAIPGASKRLLGA